MANVYWTSGDEKRTLGVVLYDDGVAVDLTDGISAIECHQVDTSDSSLTTISGLSGDANGAVVTTFTDALVTGRYTLEWQTTSSGGQIVTYPGQGSARPVLIVREEGD